MSEIQKFNFDGAADVRVIERDGEPWFVAKDVCDVLGLGNTGQALSRLDEDEKSSITLNDGTPGTPTKVLGEPVPRALATVVARSVAPLPPSPRETFGRCRVHKPE